MSKGVRQNYTVEELCDEGREPLMDLLMDCVRNHQTVTYREAKLYLENKLNIKEIFTVQIGKVAGSLIKTLQEYDAKTPLINVLVVNSGGVPGDGAGSFLATRFGKPAYYEFGKLPIGERRKALRRASAEVFSYYKWDQIYAQAFGHTPPKEADRPEDKGQEKDGQQGGPRRGGLSESPEHLALKNYVAKYPHKLSNRFRKGKTEIEQRLLSGDEMDVLVTCAGIYVTVEVKSIRSNDYDFERGVYQCIKYRAVMQAQTPDNQRNMIAYLVTERELPPRLRNLAKFHGIRTSVLKVNKTT
jgi:hypothetical protein